MKGRSIKPKIFKPITTLQYAGHASMCRTSTGINSQFTAICREISTKQPPGMEAARLFEVILIRTSINKDSGLSF